MHTFSPSPRSDMSTSKLESADRLLKPSTLDDCVNELAGFYQDLHQHVTSDEPPTPSAVLLQDLFSHLLRPGAVIRRLIVAPQMGVLLPREAALIYLSSIFWDLRVASPEYIQVYMKHLGLFIIQERLEVVQSLEVLVWILVTNREDLDLECPPRVWLTARILYVLERLSDALRQKVKSAFLDLLTVQATTVKTNRGSLWEPGQLRSAVMASLTASGLIPVRGSSLSDG